MSLDTSLAHNFFFFLARTPEIGQGLGRIIAVERYIRRDLDGPTIIVDSEPPPFSMTY